MNYVKIEVTVDNPTNFDVPISSLDFYTTSGTAYATDGKHCSFTVVLRLDPTNLNKDVKFTFINVRGKPNPPPTPINPDTCCLNIDEDQPKPIENKCNEGYRACFVKSNSCDDDYSGIKMCLNQDAGHRKLTSFDCSFEMNCDYDKSASSKSCGFYLLSLYYL